MSQLLDTLLTPQQRIDAALDDYIKARDAHPYHASKTSIKAQMAEIDAEVIEAARDRATALLSRAFAALISADDAELDSVAQLISPILLALEKKAVL